MLFKCTRLLHYEPIYNLLSHQKELIKAFATTIVNKAFLISKFYRFWSSTVCKPMLKNGVIVELWNTVTLIQGVLDRCEEELWLTVYSALSFCKTCTCILREICPSWAIILWHSSINVHNKRSCSLITRRWPAIKPKAMIKDLHKLLLWYASIVIRERLCIWIEY